MERAEEPAGRDARPSGIAYVDGYNWYHAIFKHHPAWKWLNVQSFVEALRPRERVLSVKMFSAIIDQELPSSAARDRQKRYLDAIRTLPKVSVLYGRFQPRTVHCKADCLKPYVIQEEKKTDVNIAVELISDAVSGACDAMWIVSGDSDLQPAVEWISKNRPKVKLVVYVPALESEQATRRLDYFRTRGLPVECCFLPLENLKDHQMKGCVRLNDGGFAVRPHSWGVSSAATMP